MKPRNPEDSKISETLKPLSPTIKNSKILVFGDLMIDKYVYGETTRISPEAPVPVLRHQSEEFRLGGAANLASNIRSLGCEVTLVGLYSNDFHGQQLVKLCNHQDIAAFNILPDNTNPTTCKTRFVSGSQQLLRIDEEEIFEAGPVEIQKGIEVLQELVQNVDWVVVSDYAKGCLQREWLQFLLQENRTWKVFIDPKEKDWSQYLGADLLSPNFKEFCEAFEFQAPIGSNCKKMLNTHTCISEAAKQLSEQFQLGALLITRGALGLSFVNADFSYEEKSQAKEVFDVSGAGDTVLASFCVAQVQGLDIQESIHRANVAAKIAVSKKGTAQVTSAELQEVLNGRHWHRKMVTEVEFLQQAKLARSQGKRIVFTNGCFDVIHRGHIQYLQEASEKGDLLFLGLNSDSSVAKLKGPTRPVNSQADRAFVLGNLQSVDWICVFDTDTPEHLIQEIKPDVLVKGGDYKIEEVVGGKWAKSVELVSFVDGYSTSNTLKKLEG